MGPSILALLEVEFDGATLLAADAIIAGVAQSIRRTRRGRAWDIGVAVDKAAGDATQHVYYISLERIADLEEEDLRLLVECGHDSTSVKERLIVAAGVNRPADYEFIERLARLFVEKFGGVAGRALQ